MDDRENSSLKGNAEHNLEEGAKTDSKATDSWLIYLFRDIGKTFRWGKKEIDLVVDSTRCAFSTTKRITKRMVMRPERDSNLSSSEEALLQELSFEVSDCPDDDYLSSRHDGEFRQPAKQLHTHSGNVGGKAAAREEPRQEKTQDDISMAESRRPKMKWYSPMALAYRANDGFLTIARSAGKTVRIIQSGTTGGLSKIEHALSRKNKEEKSSRQTGSVNEELLQQEAIPEAAYSHEGVAPSPANGEAAGPLQSRSDPLTEEEPQLDDEMDQEEPEYRPLDLEAFLKQRYPRDRVQAIRLRKTLDDLLLGSEAARQSALKNLVGLRQVAEPFMVSSLQTASPQVAEIAIAGLSQIGSQRLIGCISDVHASSDPELRMVALRAAQRLADDEARPFLERGLRDPDAKVKRRTLSYLSWHDSPWALAEIKRLCNDPESEVKWAALEALLTVRPSEAYYNLELMMPSLDPAYRRRAITLLEQRKSLLNEDSTNQTPNAPGLAPALDVGEKTKERGHGKKHAEKILDAHSSQVVLLKNTGEKKSSQPGRARDINEDAPADETPERSGRSPYGVTTESDND